MQKCRRLAGLLLVLTLGCSPDFPDEVPPPEGTNPPAAGSTFEAGRTGTVSGVVVWNGDRPQWPEMFVRPLTNDPPGMPRHRPNPNLPVVNPTTQGVGNAVVFLRGVDPNRAAAWRHGPVHVVMKDFQFDVIQDQRRGSVGFVWPGAVVEMVSRQEAFHALRAGGAAFFTLPFPDADRPARRRFEEPGLVELTSGAGYFWMRGHLFVAEHPYYAAANEQGRFTLPDVPEGRYELVCWLPNWNIHREDRDPESGRISRLTFAAPLELVRTINVEGGQRSEARFEVTRESFAP